MDKIRLTSWGNGSLSHYFNKVLYILPAVVWDFWSINSIKDRWKIPSGGIHPLEPPPETRLGHDWIMIGWTLHVWITKPQPWTAMRQSTWTSENLDFLQPGKINGWNIIPWRFGSDHFSFFSWVICRFHVNLPGCIPFLVSLHWNPTLPLCSSKLPPRPKNTTFFLYRWHS